MNSKFKQAGLSMIEILTVTAILGILVIIAMSQLPKQLDKAKDGKRKSDLQKIKIAYENYYNDEGCYPIEGTLDTCGGAALHPYLKEIPCDPGDLQPYIYYPEPEPEVADCPQHYRVWANLYREDDPQSIELNCGHSGGCGLTSITEIVEDIVGSAEEASEYNYGVSEGVPVSLGDPEVLICCSDGGACNAWLENNGSICFIGPFITYEACVLQSECSE